MSQKFKSPYFWFMLVAVVGFSVLLYSSRGLLYETWLVIQSANLALVLLLPVIQVVNYFLIGGYYRTMFGFFGAKISWPRSWGVVASLNFVNQILPSGGLSGISYIAYGFRTSLEIGKTTMVQTGRYLFSFMSYVVIAPVALLLLLADGNNGSFMDLVDRLISNPTALITLILFGVMITIFITFIKSRRSAQRYAKVGETVINRFGRIFGKPNLLPSKTTKKMVNDFHDGIDFFKGEKSHMLKPFAFMVLSVCMELSIVYVSLLAVGAEVSFAAAFASFLAANIVGIISIVPGDVGVHEAVMTTMLVAFGVPAPIALSAVLLYRVFNKVIFLPIGFYFYTVLLKPAKSEAS
jgi:uncharacterized protein (TIRG00374 family)